jgi:hypothetical protein
MSGPAGFAPPPTSQHRFNRLGVRVFWTLIVLASLLFLSRYRVLPDLFLLASVILWRKKTQYRSAYVAAAVVVGFLCLEFLVPGDISTLYRPGPPRLLPLVMGLPTRETFLSARKGEIVLGGCILRGNEPRWILVW